MVGGGKVDDKEGRIQTILTSMRSATFAGTSQPIFTTATILGLIVFFFYSLQCLSKVAVVMKETQSWRLAAAQLLFYTGMGYALAVAAVQGLRAMGVS